MSPTGSDRLILILTRRCNLRCGWCPQEFEDRDMDLETLNRALEAAARRARAPTVVKLFGGEPLLRPDLVMSAVRSARALLASPSIELPTNGTLLDEKLCVFLRRHPEVEVQLSRPCAWAASLPNVSFNFLLGPGEAAERACRRFLDVVTSGQRRFNFLPAYFIEWTDGELAELRRTFSGLAALLGRLRGKGVPVEVENIRRVGATALFNDGLVVDTDGSLYGTNAILIRGAKAASRKLRLGGVDDLARVQAHADPAPLLAACFSPGAERGTLRVDAALTSFVRGLEAAR